MIRSKANSPAETSSGIVVSFDAKWLELILADRFRKVLRKRVPVSTRPEWIYIYVNAPTSALVAKSAIKSIGEIGLADAIKTSKDLCLTESQIRFYFSDSMRVGMYTLGRVHVADTPLNLTELRSKMVFHPPQSFLFLSLQAKETIDVCAQFRR